MSVLPVGIGSEEGGYQIERSLRFNSPDSAYLNRTPASAGNRKTWTWSGWVKRGSLGGIQMLFASYFANNDNSQTQVVINSDNTVGISFFNFSAVATTQLFRDPSAWYHLVFAFDTTQSTASNRVKVYVNGSQVTAFSVDARSSITQNGDYAINAAQAHFIGYGNFSNSYLNGYLTEINFIDGSALTPTSFGEFNSNTGVWQPIEYTGTYGTNGFYLPFSDNASTTTLGDDFSGNGNDWTTNNFSVTGTTITYPASTVTGSAGLRGAFSLFDGSTDTSVVCDLSSDNFILFTPTTGISYSSTVEVFCYAANGFNITNYYSVNGGAEVTFTGGSAGFNGFNWITVASGSGTLTSLKIRITRTAPNETSVNWCAIRIDGTIITNSYGRGNDSLVDTPTRYGTDTGAGGEVRGNYATWNAVDKDSDITLTNGNLDASQTANNGIAKATFGVSSGKWYWEVTPTSGFRAADVDVMLGIAKEATAVTDAYVGSAATSYGYFSANGQKYNNGSGSAYGDQFSTNDVIGVALDLDAGTLVFYKNNVSQGTAYSSLSGTFFPATGNNQSNACVVNFGQRPFVYTAPSGFKALVTTNLPAPTIEDGGEYFNTVLYTGTGSTRSVSGVGFQPDFLWIKSRGASANHALYDVIRGGTNALRSNTTGAESQYGDAVITYQTDGFQIAGTSVSGVNGSSESLVAWNWKANGAGVTNTAGTITSTVSANTTSGFSIVRFTGTDAVATVGHGLGAVPKFMILKGTQRSDWWGVYHVSLGNTKYLQLNTTSAEGTSSTLWNNTTPTSTVFTLADQSAINPNGELSIAYVFAEVPGYSAFGSYTGNGSADGVFIYLGFRPRYWLVKASSTGGENWTLLDSVRDPYNLDDAQLYPNLNNAEANDGNGVDFLSNGIKIRSAIGNWNTNAVTYIYAAFAENPFSIALAR